MIQDLLKLFEFEAAIALPVFAIVFVMYRKMGEDTRRRIGACIHDIARRRAAVVLLVGILAFAGSAAVGLLVRFPEPFIHDEFSNLLAADTFSAGRLTNPTHPFWEHFETFHVLQKPTYASKYPPARGLVMALGQSIAHPAVGVWLAIGLMCGCLTWMLQGWLPPKWALIGGILAALNFGFFGYWSQSYWGGTMSAAGGALVFGALPRLKRGASVFAAVALAAGLVVLANSRPFEGLIVSIPALFVLFRDFFRSGRARLKTGAVRVFLPAVGVIAAGAAWMGYYNYRVTGDAFRMPYQAHHGQYSACPVFLWLEPGELPPRCRGIFREHTEKQIENHRSQSTPGGFLWSKARSMKSIIPFFLRFIFLVPFLVALSLWRDRRVRLALVVVGLVTVAALLENQTATRKFGPATGCIVFLVAAGLRRISLMRWHRLRFGPAAAAAVPVVCAVSVAFSCTPVTQAPPVPFAARRAALVESLKAFPGRDLVIVRYGPRHVTDFELVYNRADIDNADIVWARELGGDRDRRLIEYFKGRTKWLLDGDSWTREKWRIVRLKD